MIKMKDLKIREILEMLRKKPKYPTEHQIHTDYKIKKHICRKIEGDLKSVIPKCVIGRVI